MTKNRAGFATANTERFFFAIFTSIDLAVILPLLSPIHTRLLMNGLQS